jgi:hypothetical protein
MTTRTAVTREEFDAMRERIDQSHEMASAALKNQVEIKERLDAIWDALSHGSWVIRWAAKIIMSAGALFASFAAIRAGLHDKFWPWVP